MGRVGLELAAQLKGRLLYKPGVMVTSAPYQLRSSEGLDQDADV